MTKKPINIKKWLDIPCKANEISCNTDGSQYIPIGLVEEKLNQLTGGNYNTKNFNFQTFTYEKHIIISGSIELTINIEGAERVLVGATTFNSREYAPNMNWASTAKSECIKNAAKSLGRQFGSHLNGKQEKRNNGKEVLTEEKKELKLQIQEPDQWAIDQYNLAFKAGDNDKLQKLENMYSFNESHVIKD